MASKKTVNLDNLVALGPERLAAILVDLAAGDADVKRRLRLELAAQAGGGDAVAADRQLPEEGTPHNVNYGNKNRYITLVLNNVRAQRAQMFRLAGLRPIEPPGCCRAP